MAPLPVNPWLSMWTSPKETIRSIVSFKPARHLFWLAAIIGWPVAIQLAQIYSLAQSNSLRLILITTALVSPLIGFTILLFFSGVIHLIGKCMGSLSSFKNTIAAVAWSHITGVVPVISYIILIAYFKAGWFSTDWINMSVDRFMVYILFCLFLAQIISFGWTLYLLIQSLAEVHQFPIWKATANLVLAFLVLMGVIKLFYL